MMGGREETWTTRAIGVTRPAGCAGSCVEWTAQPQDKAAAVAILNGDMWEAAKLIEGSLEPIATLLAAVLLGADPAQCCIEVWSYDSPERLERYDTAHVLEQLRTLL
jgi:apolipoprotein N-acyltransferase